MDVGADLESIRGAEVTAVTLDYRVSLLLIDPETPQRLGATLVVGVPFTFGAAGSTVVIDAETPSTLAATWQLLRRTIVSAAADDDLNLVVEFDDGSILSVLRNDRYEAWELSGRGVRGVLVGPR